MSDTGKKTKIVIQYPPDFDGELHIDAVENRDRKGKIDAFQFTFIHAAVEGDAWKTLVKAAKGIIAQDSRSVRSLASSSPRLDEGASNAEHHDFHDSLDAVEEGWERRRMDVPGGGHVSKSGTYWPPPGTPVMLDDGTKTKIGGIPTKEQLLAALSDNEKNTKGEE